MTGRLSARRRPLFVPLLPIKAARLGLPALVVSGVLMAGCAGIERAPLHTAPAATSAEASLPIERQAVPAATPRVPSPSLTTEVAAVVPAPAVQVAEPARAQSPVVNQAPNELAKAPPPVKTQTPTPPRVKPAPPPPLDLKSLETRLKETKAIGIFTKLTLKNQIDDLLKRFRAHYEGRIKTSLVELRLSFDLLVMKTLALLQDADPPLAGALASSRESIWGILSDPKKFATV
jgi:hypothetical protein